MPTPGLAKNPGTVPLPQAPEKPNHRANPQSDVQNAKRSRFCDDAAPGDTFLPAAARADRLDFARRRHFHKKLGNSRMLEGNRWRYYRLTGNAE